MNVFDKSFITELVNEVKNEAKKELLASWDIESERKRVYSGVEACEYLGVTPPTLNRLVREGYLEKHYMNGMERPCYLKEDLDEYVNESKRD